MASDKRTKMQGRVEYVADLQGPLIERCGYTKEAFARVVLNALTVNPALADCQPASLDQAILASLQAGLVPDGREAVIVPFRGKAELIPTIQGQIKLATRATPGLTFRVMGVYADDEWEYSEGLHPRLHHVPNPQASHTVEDLIYAYAVARVPGAGDPQYDVMSRAEIDRYRAYSRSSAWAEHFHEQALNPVMRRLLKRLPKSSSLPEAPQELERRIYGGEDVVGMDPEVPAGVDPTTGEVLDLNAPHPDDAVWEPAETTGAPGAAQPPLGGDSGDSPF